MPTRGPRAPRASDPGRAAPIVLIVEPEEGPRPVPGAFVVPGASGGSGRSLRRFGEDARGARGPGDRGADLDRPAPAEGDAELDSLGGGWSFGGRPGLTDHPVAVGRRRGCRRARGPGRIGGAGLVVDGDAVEG